jgi:DNA replication protein DnaC
MNLSSYIDGLERTAAEAIKAEQGDYFGEDGLLVCGKCHTPKQCRVELFGKVKTPMCLCKCGAERQEKEYEAIRASEMEFKYDNFKGYAASSDFELLSWIDARNYKISAKLVKERQALLKKICFPEADMSHWNFGNDDGANEKVSQIMRNYAEHFDEMREKGKGILLFGKVGRGKSFLAACVGNALIERGIPALMTNFSRIERESNRDFSKRQEYFDALNKFPLLILDDLGTERDTKFMNEVVYTVIDSRAKAGLPTIVTTNLTAEELKSPANLANQQVFSRLLELCIPIEVAGDDRRRDKLREDFGTYKDLLGI